MTGVVFPTFWGKLPSALVEFDSLGQLVLKEDKIRFIIFFVCDSSSRFKLIISRVHMIN